MIGDQNGDFQATIPTHVIRRSSSNCHRDPEESDMEIDEVEQTDESRRHL